jgi:hypothetical protein
MQFRLRFAQRLSAGETIVYGAKSLQRFERLEQLERFEPRLAGTLALTKRFA